MPCLYYICCSLYSTTELFTGTPAQTYSSGYNTQNPKELRKFPEYCNLTLINLYDVNHSWYEFLYLLGYFTVTYTYWLTAAKPNLRQKDFVTYFSYKASQTITEIQRPFSLILNWTGSGVRTLLYITAPKRVCYILKSKANFSVKFISIDTGVSLLIFLKRHLK